MRSQQRLPTVVRATRAHQPAGVAAWAMAACVGVLALLWSLAPALHVWGSGCEAHGQVVATFTPSVDEADAECGHGHDHCEHGALPANAEDAPPSPARDRPNHPHGCATCDLILAGSSMGLLVDVSLESLAAFETGVRAVMPQDALAHRAVHAAHARGPPRA